MKPWAKIKHSSLWVDWLRQFVNSNRRLMQKTQWLVRKCLNKSPQGYRIGVLRCPVCLLAQSCKGMDLGGWKCSIATLWGLKIKAREKRAMGGVKPKCGWRFEPMAAFPSWREDPAGWNWVRIPCFTYSADKKGENHVIHVDETCPRPNHVINQPTRQPIRVLYLKTLVFLAQKELAIFFNTVFLES